MRISGIFIKKYGKFEDFTIPLNGGFNLIYGENEAGKTTLNSFIRRMAYGMPLRDRSGLKTNDRLRYTPLTGGNMQGSLKLELENGEKILVSRTFGKTASADRLSVLNDTTGEEVPRFRDEENLGEILFGCSDGMFEKTLWFRQNGTYMGGNDDEITRRLINLAVSGDEDVSTKAAAEKLTAIQKSLKAPDNRSAPGKIDKLTRELNELTDERLRLERKSEQLAEAEQLLTALTAERSAIEKSIEKYQELQKTVEVKQKFEIVQKIEQHSAEIETLKSDENYVKFCRNIIENNSKNGENKLILIQKNSEIEEIIKSQKNEELKKDDSELSALVKKKNGRYLLHWIGLLIFAGGILGYFGMDDWLFLILSAVGIAIAAFAWFDVRKLKPIVKELTESCVVAVQEEQDKTARLDTLKTEVEEIYAELGVASYGELLERTAEAERTAVKIELLQENIRILLDGKDFEELRRAAERFEPTSQVLEMNKTRIDETLNNGQAKLLQISEKIQDAARMVNMIAADEQTLAAVETNIKKCEEELETAKFELDAVKLAVDTFDVAVSEMKNNFTPRLNSAANEVIESITNGKYGDLRISEDLDIKVSRDGELIEGEILSAGAFDQIYFSLRMAIIKLLCGENKILFMDDTFTQYDDVRMKAAFDYILELSRDMQVIMFTCQSRELELARKYGVNVVML